jgi:hypothetical protein
MSMPKPPRPPFEHVLRLSDERGIFEHADGVTPRYECGYCLDDVARALVVVCRQRPAAPDVAALTGRYFDFVVSAQAPDGLFHNRMDRHGAWEDQPSAGDWWGRALWGLGTAAARCTNPSIRRSAVERFELSAGVRSPFPRAMAFAVLGAAEMLTVVPGHLPSRDLMSAAVSVIGRPDFGRAWPWPQPRLEYANAALAEALIAAGRGLGDDLVLADGLALLGWLLDLETSDGHLSVTGVGGWGPGDARPAFDQQPIEVAALADACHRAYQVTGDDRWAIGLRRAVGWFMGDNDGGMALYDASTGGGCDALTPGGRNTNQGAESTLAMVSTLQHGTDSLL